MHESSDSRSKYLSLALASRKALRSIDDYIEQGKRDTQFEKTVNEVIESLKATRATRDALNLFGPVPEATPFTNYEQLLTLEEVVSDLKDPDIIENLGNLLTIDADAESRRRNAGRFICVSVALLRRRIVH